MINDGFISAEIPAGRRHWSLVRFIANPRGRRSSQPGRGGLTFALISLEKSLAFRHGQFSRIFGGWHRRFKHGSAFENRKRRTRGSHHLLIQSAWYFNLRFHESNLDRRESSCRLGRTGYRDWTDTRLPAFLKRCFSRFFHALQLLFFKFINQSAAWLWLSKSLRFLLSKSQTQSKFQSILVT